jgi:hypothetical protein
MLEEWYFDMQQYRGLLVNRWREFEDSRVRASDSYIKFFNNLLNKYLLLSVVLLSILLGWPHVLGVSQLQAEYNLLIAAIGLFISGFANFMARGFILIFTRNSILLLDKIIERKSQALAQLDRFFNNKNDWSKKARGEFTLEIIQIDNLADLYRKMLNNSIHRKCIPFLYSVAKISFVYSLLIIMHIFTKNSLDIRYAHPFWIILYYALPGVYFFIIHFINHLWLKNQRKKLSA